MRSRATNLCTAAPAKSHYSDKEKYGDEDKVNSIAGAGMRGWVHVFLFRG